MGEQWHVRRSGVAYGPFSEGQLKQLAASGRLTPDDMVREGAKGEWGASRTVNEFFPGAAAANSPEAGFAFQAMDQRPAKPAHLNRTHHKPLLLAGAVLGVGVCLVAIVVVMIAVSGSRERATLAQPNREEKLTGVAMRPSPKNQGDTKQKPKEEKKETTPFRYPVSTTAYYRFEEGAGTGVVNSVDGSVEGTHNANFIRETSMTRIPLTGEENKFGLEFKGKEVATVRSVFPFHRESGDATLEFWLKVEDKNAGTVIWSSPTPKDVNRFNILVGGGSLGCDYRTPSGERHAILEAGEDGKFRLTANVWTHIAIIRNGTTYCFYKNGSETHAVTDGNPDLPTTTAWTIGGRPGWRFTGLVDEVRFSNKALSPGELLNASPK